MHACACVCCEELRFHVDFVQTSIIGIERERFLASNIVEHGIAELEPTFHQHTSSNDDNVEHSVPVFFPELLSDVPFTAATPGRIDALLRPEARNVYPASRMPTLSSTLSECI